MSMNSILQEAQSEVKTFLSLYSIDSRGSSMVERFGNIVERMALIMRLQNPQMAENGGLLAGVPITVVVLNNYVTAQTPEPVNVCVSMGGELLVQQVEAQMGKLAAGLVAMVTPEQLSDLGVPLYEVVKGIKSKFDEYENFLSFHEAKKMANAPAPTLKC